MKKKWKEAMNEVLFYTNREDLSRKFNELK